VASSKFSGGFCSQPSLAILSDLLDLFDGRRGRLLCVLQPQRKDVYLSEFGVIVGLLLGLDRSGEHDETGVKVLVFLKNFEQLYGTSELLLVGEAAVLSRKALVAGRTDAGVM
jgi:hypothetical protein